MENKNRILYVDDEVLNLTVFQLTFKNQYEVITAKNGLEGLQSLDANPDVYAVISDMKMPEMNGIEFIKKANSKYPEKKYFILTGFSITDEIKQALDEGLILEYFQKPFNKALIQSSIDSN